MAKTNPYNDTLDLSDKLLKGKQDKATSQLKARNARDTLSLKKLELSNAQPDSTDIAGDVMLGAASSMASKKSSPRNGLMEGLLRVFGGAMKGMSADAKRQKINDFMDVMDYKEQTQQHAKGTLENINNQREDMTYAPAQNQFEQSYSDGTLEPTMRSALKERGMNPDNVQLSSDGMTLFIDNGQGQIKKMPVSDIFSPEESEKWNFINNTQKANLARSENKQIQGLAQENMQLSEKAKIYESIFRSQGHDPKIAFGLAQGIDHGLQQQQIEEGLENRKVDIDEGYKYNSLSIQQQNANTNRGRLTLEQQKENGKPGTEENTYGSIPTSVLGGKGVHPFMQTINAEINLSKSVPMLTKMMKNARNIVSSTKGLGAFITNILASNDLTKPILPEDIRVPFEILDKGANRVIEAFMQARGSNLTDEERKTMKKGLFNAFLHPKSNLSNIQSVFEELNLAKIRGEFASSELKKGFIYTPQGFEQYLKENPQLEEKGLKDFNGEEGIPNNETSSPSGSNMSTGLLGSIPEFNNKMVAIIDPKGRSGQIPESNLDAALKKGYKVK